QLLIAAKLGHQSPGPLFQALLLRREPAAYVEAAAPITPLCEQQFRDPAPRRNILGNTTREIREIAACQQPALSPLTLHVAGGGSRHCDELVVQILRKSVPNSPQDVADHAPQPALHRIPRRL